MNFAVVIPRYDADIGGGAETLARGLAQELVRQGHHVEVWTSCARDHYTWRNELPPSIGMVDGVQVRRFLIDHWSPEERARLDIRLRAYRQLDRADQYAWVESGPISSALCRHIAIHAAAFDWIVALPYANPMIHAAVWMAPMRTLLWPCLHDEPYAYMEPVHLLLDSVGGVLFNSPEEQAFVLKKISAPIKRHAVIGVGVDFIATPSVQRSGLLYVGRLEEGKNVGLLYRYVQRMISEGDDINLAVAGSGPLRPPEHPALCYWGYVDEAHKATLYANALALVQPSVNESFSIVAMEGWLSGTPALVNEGCAVTRGHVMRSRGGLAYQGYADFADAVRWLNANPEMAQRMGSNGRRYVTNNYTWPRVVERFLNVVGAWKSESVRP